MAKAQVHPTAVVDPGARLAGEVVVGPHAVIEGDVTIGAGTRIWPHAFIGRFAQVGEGCQIHMGAVVSHVPQDHAFDPDWESRCVIGDGTVVREYAQIHRGTKPGTETVVGSGCMLMAVSHVAHNCRVGDGVILTNGAGLGGYVEVGERAFLSAYVVVHQLFRVGRLAMLAGDCRVSMDVPPFHTASGRNVLQRLNAVGLRRAGISPAAQKALRSAHKTLFRSDLPMEQALAAVEAAPTEPEVAELVTFIRTSERGVIRPARRGSGRV